MFENFGKKNQEHIKGLLPYLMVPFIIFLASLPLPPSYQRITVLFLIYAVMALAWVVVLKMGYVSLGSAAFYGAGAYFFTYLIKLADIPSGIPYLIAVLIAIPFIALIAAVVGYVTMRLAGIFFIFSTFAASEALRQVFMYSEINYSGFVGKIIPSSLSAMQAIGVFSFLLAVAGMLFYVTTIDRYRVVIDFIREDEELARVFGVETLKYKILFFTAGSSLQGVTGSFAAWYLAYIDPDLVFNPMISIQVLVIGLLGGTTSFLGAIAAAALIVFLSEQLIRIASHIYLIVLGISILLVSKYMREGFSGFISGFASRIWKFNYRR